jgi:hypothetical protein
VRVKSHIRFPFLGLQHTDELIAFDDVAAVDEQLLKAPLNLGADNDVVGRDDASESDLTGMRAKDEVEGDRENYGGNQ